MEYTVKRNPKKNTSNPCRWTGHVDLENKPIDVNEDDPFDEYLTVVSYAIRSSYHQTHGHSPAQLVYGRNMFSPVSVDVDWNAIREKKQLKINKNNNKENSKRNKYHILIERVIISL